MSRSLLFRTVSKLLVQAIKADSKFKGFKISRREGIAAAYATSMAAYLQACKTTGGDSEGQSQTSSEGPVIIGGGAAGLSAAYYLQKAGMKARIIEASDRLGGRIYTQYNFNKEGMFCERGGELIDTGHTHIQALMKELNLELQKLPDETLAAEVHYFGGKWHSEAELLAGFKGFASYIANDIKSFIVDGEFKMPTYRDPISDRVKLLDHLTLQDYLDQAKSICPQWIRDLIRVAYVGEYGLDAEQQSAINLVSFIGTDLSQDFKMFGESDEIYRVKGGNSQLIDALTKKLEGQYVLNQKLISIADASDGRLQLLFQAGDKIVEVKTKMCIMTIPFTVLRGIDGIGKLGLSSTKLRAIREIGYGTNSKLMLGFTSAPWRKKSASHPANDGALLSDMPFQGGWDTSRRQEGSSAIFTNFMGGRYAETFEPGKMKSSIDCLEKVYKGIAQLHDGNAVLQVWPGVATAKGSYICPKPGQYTSLMGSLGEPELEGRLLFAGEHTSDAAAGFMTGAVESGLRAATLLLEKQTKVESF